MPGDGISEHEGTVAGQNRVMDGSEDKLGTKQQLENKQKASAVRSDHTDENCNQIEDRVRVDSGYTLDADNRTDQLASASIVNETVKDGDLEKRNIGLYKYDMQKTKVSTDRHCQPAGLAQKAEAVPVPARDLGETENRNSHVRERGEPGDSTEHARNHTPPADELNGGRNSENGGTGGNIHVNGNSSAFNVHFGSNNVFSHSNFTFIAFPPNTVPSCNVSQPSARPSTSEQSDTEHLSSDESLHSRDHNTDSSSNIASDDLEERGLKVCNDCSASQPSGSSMGRPTAVVCK